MTESEKRLAAKIPGADTGIEVRPTMCDICTPGMQCGVNAYVRDGKIVKLEGADGFPGSGGKLCTRGAAGRQYLYRKDRIRTPLRRIGPKGSDEFVPIGWDEALDICAERLLAVRAGDPDGTVFLTGYSKWYRPFLQRLAHVYGTRNYLTESSTCHQAEVMSYTAVFGRLMNCRPGRANTILAWGLNAPVNAFPLGRALFERHEKNARIVVIDPRMTHSAQKLADLYLRPRVGTDAALAHGMARHILVNGWEDRSFLDRYVHGFDEYREYVARFTPEETERLTGVPAGDMLRAAEMLAADPTAVVLPSNALTHRVNGFNTHRAVLSLMALLGRVDRPGFLLPQNESFCHSDGGFVSREEEFIHSVTPAGCKPPVGHERFPLWADMVNEGQAMDLVRQIETGRPYPIRAMSCFGVNDRMYPESSRFLAAMDRLDFCFSTELFWTDVCRRSDIVLPVCTSYERGEVKCYAGRFVNWTKPAVEPLYESRPDTYVIQELAKRMKLGDELLEAGYDEWIRYIFAPSGIEDWQAVRVAPLPVPTPRATKYEPGSYLAAIPTPSGKIELYSEAVARYADRGLRPLPEYLEEAPDPGYPFTLIAGARHPHTIHSRVHDVPWLRSLRPEPAVDLCHADAERLGVRQGDDLWLRTPKGRIRVKASITEAAAPGELLMIHGYREANVNELLDADRLDPYTGFPAYKQFPCAAEKCGEE